MGLFDFLPDLPFPSLAGILFDVRIGEITGGNSILGGNNPLSPITEDGSSFNWALLLGVIVIVLMLIVLLK